MSDTKKIFSKDELDSFTTVLKLGNILITGPSGTGKSFLGHELEKLGLPVISIDAHGKREGGHFIVKNLPHHDKGFIYYGKVNFDPKEFSELHVELLLVPIPSTELYHDMQKAKYEQGVKEKMPEKWLETWNERSKWPETKIQQDIVEEANLVASQISKQVGAEPLVVFKKMDKMKEVLKGWD